MRIAVISRVFSKTGGGAESYSVALVQQLAARHDIHVFAQESNYPVDGVTYHRVFRLSQKPRWINQLLFALATWINTRNGFDVVHSHENTWHGLIQTIHVRPLFYNLFVVHGGIRWFLQWFKVAFSPRLIAYVLLERSRFRLSARKKIVATSQNLLTECEVAFPQSTSMLSVITPGTTIPHKHLSREVARQQLELPADGRLILFVANDFARKGLDALLQAMVLISSDIRLAVAGSTKQAPHYLQLAAELGLSARVHFLGSLNDLSPAYCAADCLVHPTLEDSFAMVVLEAMAHGLPVLVSGPKYCGISRQLTDGKEALLLANPRDARHLATCIDTVLGKPELSEHLRQHGLVFAQAHSWESAALQYELLYRQVVSGRV